MSNNNNKIVTNVLKLQMRSMNTLGKWCVTYRVVVQVIGAL